MTVDSSDSADFNISVLLPGRFFADKAGGKGDLSDNLNAATPSFETVTRML